MAVEIWFLMAIGSAFLVAVANTFDKFLTEYINPQIIPAIKKIINGSLLLVFSFLFLDTYFPGSSSLWLFVAILAVLDVFSTVLYFMAIKRDEVSRLVPYQNSLIILLTFSFSILLLSESFTPLKGAGALLIAMGAYGILTDGELKLPSSIGACVMITVGALFWTAYELIVKVGVSSIPPYLLAILVYYVGSPLLWGFNLSKNREDVRSLPSIFNGKLLLVLLGGCVGAAFSCLLMYFALSSGPASVVLPLAHTSPLFLVLLSGRILKEGSIPHKLLFSTAIVAGIFILYIL